MAQTFGAATCSEARSVSGGETGGQVSSPFEQFFRDYAAAFDEFDAESVASFFHCPCLMVNGESASALTTEGAQNGRLVSDPGPTCQND